MTNIDNYLYKLNKDLKEKKEQSKKDLLEKIYPKGSYYWREKDNSPSNIFGGRWKKIEGRFLFPSDSSHYVGKTGGEESHRLTIDEIPSHYHGYTKIQYSFSYYRKDGDSSNYACQCNSNTDESFYIQSTTDYSGGNYYHNNMSPYLTANCWKRID